MIGILPKLTRDYIEKYVEQTAIFAKYLDIPESEIHKCLNSNYIIKSPLRTDNNPTCGFYYQSGKLRMQDFAGYFHGDCYDVVGYRNLLNTRDSVEFAKIMDIIAKDFKIHKYENEVTNHELEFYKFDATKNKQKVIIEVQFREFGIQDQQYWGKYSVELERLDKHKIYPVYAYWINSQLRYMNSFDDVCYGYYAGVDKIDGRELWQMYHPYRDTAKFITNYSAIRGTANVKTSDYGIITKSVKDVVILDLFDVNSCSLAAEGIIPTTEEFKKINLLWKTTYSLLDFDRTGIRMANKLRKKGIQSLFLTNGKLHTYNYGAKDISDFIEIYGFNATKELIQYLKEESIDSINSIDYFDFLKLQRIGKFY